MNLHTLAVEMDAVFCEERPVMSASERIVELAEGQWMGRWEGRVMFRDPVTGSSCCIPEDGLTVAVVMAKLQSKRIEFGLGVNA